MYASNKSNELFNNLSFCIGVSVLLTSPVVINFITDFENFKNKSTNIVTDIDLDEPEVEQIDQINTDSETMEDDINPEDKEKTIHKELFYNLEFLYSLGKESDRKKRIIKLKELGIFSKKLLVSLDAKASRTAFPQAVNEKNRENRHKRWRKKFIDGVVKCKKITKVKNIY